MTSDLMQHTNSSRQWRCQVSRAATFLLTWDLTPKISEFPLMVFSIHLHLVLLPTSFPERVADCAVNFYQCILGIFNFFYFPFFAFVSSTFIGVFLVMFFFISFYFYYFCVYFVCIDSLFLFTYWQWIRSLLIMICFIAFWCLLIIMRHYCW